MLSYVIHNMFIIYFEQRYDSIKTCHVFIYDISIKINEAVQLMVTHVSSNLYVIVLSAFPRNNQFVTSIIPSLFWRDLLGSSSLNNLFYAEEYYS